MKRSVIITEEWYQHSVHTKYIQYKQYNILEEKPKLPGTYYCESAGDPKSQNFLKEDHFIKPCHNFILFCASNGKESHKRELLS